MSISLKSPFILLAILFTTQAYGQLTIDAQFRPRFELRNGYTTLPQKNNEAVLLTSQRTRVNIGYKLDKHLSGYFSAQDIRIWGESEPLEKDANLNIYQTWLRFAPVEWFSLKLGRQELEYDNHKLMGKADWRQQGRTHDAALIGLQSKDSSWTVDMALASNQDREVLFKDTYDGRNYKNLHMLHINKNLISAEVSFILVNLGQQQPDTSVNYTQTFGLYGVKTLGNFSLNGHYYYQTGKALASTDINVNAYWVASEVSYHPTQKINLAIGFDILSGTSAESLSDLNANSNTFVPLLARRHRYFGRQDMFYFGGFDVPVGLKDIYLKISHQINEKWLIHLDTHGFSTFSALSDGNGGTLNKNLGLELDLLYTYTYNDFFSIDGGYSQFFATNTMVALKGRGNKNQLTNFFYITFDFRPMLFEKTSNK
jgi:hypothetical protein